MDVLLLLEHITKCKAHVRSMKAVERCVVIAQQLITRDQVTVYRADEDNPVLGDVVVSPEVCVEETFPARWAQRPKRGYTMGKNFVGPLKKDIDKFVLDGVIDKGRKRLASRMVERIIASNPGRYDIPSVHHITSYVQTVLRRLKAEGVVAHYNAISAKANTKIRKVGTCPSVCVRSPDENPGRATESDVQGLTERRGTVAQCSLPDMQDTGEASVDVSQADRRRGRKGMDHMYASIIEELHVAHPEMTPSAVRTEMLNRVSNGLNNEGFVSAVPTLVQVTNKIGYLRTKRRRI